MPASPTPGSAAKRAFDLAVCVVSLPFVIPVVLILAIAIRAHDGGPGLFRQVRVGRSERPFVLFKLRTMSTDTGDLPSHHASPAKITGIGAFLRRTKLDELPQLFNVMRGDMSLVGPRPCLPSQQDLIEQRRLHGVFSARPGITGLAQVDGLTMEHPVELARRDGDYVRQRSLGGDLKLLFRTALGSGSGDAVR
jgi:O-antigen biosynthesis protein WbqP